MKIGIFTCLCERDIEWLPQFMKQVEILGYDVSWYAVHLSQETLIKLETWERTASIRESMGQFTEASKGFALNRLKDLKYDWAIQMDIDETWEENAKELIESSLAANPDGLIGDCRMITVFKEGDKLYQRDDEYFKTGTESSRWRIYNLKYEWRWNDGITCGGYLVKNGGIDNTFKPFPCPAHSVHWGYWTYELMEKHRKKWDEVYTKIIGRNPYPHVYEKHINGTVQFEKIPLLEKYYKHLWQ